MLSCSTPAEWIRPLRRPVLSLTYFTASSCLLKSPITCSTTMPNFAAVSLHASQLGAFCSLILPEREINSIFRFFLGPSFSHCPKIQVPITRPRAPLPPVIQWYHPQGS